MNHLDTHLRTSAQGSAAPRRWAALAAFAAPALVTLLLAAPGLRAQDEVTAGVRQPYRSAGQAYQAALQLYERNHWQEAYAALALLADAGHPEAARMALQMQRHGPVLYGMRFEASPIMRARWLGSAGCLVARGDDECVPAPEVLRAAAAAQP